MKKALTTDQSRQDVTGNQQKQNITKPSLRSAINKKFRECICDPISGDGTWRQQVAACSARTCPLYPVRPMPTLSIATDLNALEYSENGHFDAIVGRGEVVL
jgi:hypothetical protein